MSPLKWKLLRTFGVAPWSEEAAALTEEMCLEYAEMLDAEEAESSAGFDGAAFEEARAAEIFTADDAPQTAAGKPDTAAMSDFIERTLRCRDTGFIIY